MARTRFRRARSPAKNAAGPPLVFALSPIYNFYSRSMEEIIIRKRSMSALSHVKIWARGLKQDGHAIYLASRDPRVPWYAKFLAIAVAGYALSPIDLIPDFIPVLGYLDDLIIVPLGIWLVVSLMPEGIMVEYRAIANKAQQRPSSRAGSITIVLLWIFGTSALGWIAFSYWRQPN
jgi:uncharacterized membrane protein YkvA (DUF1232 family)